MGFAITGGIIYYSYYSLFISTSGLTAEIWKKTTRQHLIELVQRIEDYKAAKGQYPQSLTDLPSTNKGRRIYDLLSMRGKWSSKDLKLYVYDLQPGGRTYFLYSRGLDGEAFTSDDVFPQLSPEEAAKFGYRQRPSVSTLQNSRVPAGTNP